MITYHVHDIIINDNINIKHISSNASNIVNIYDDIVDTKTNSKRVTFIIVSSILSIFMMIWFVISSFV